MPPKKRRGAAAGRPRSRFWVDDDRNNAIIESNLQGLLPAAVQAARAGAVPTLETVQGWHRASLQGVRVFPPNAAGGLRGHQPPANDLTRARAHVNNVYGTEPQHVRAAVRAFFDEYDLRGTDLRARFAGRRSHEVEDDLYDETIAFLAWAHGQWIRIHPFVNNNGSTARVLLVVTAALFDIRVNLPGKPRSAAPAVALPGRVLTYDNAAADQMQTQQDDTMQLYLQHIV